jgi:hypothetical protein
MSRPDGNQCGKSCCDHQWDVRRRAKERKSADKCCQQKAYHQHGPRKRHLGDIGMVCFHSGLSRIEFSDIVTESAVDFCLFIDFLRIALCQYWY